MDGSVRGARGVTEVLQLPPLGVVPYIENEADRERRLVRRRWWWRAGWYALGVVALLVLLFHFLVLPLDVAWFSFLRRLGI
jgi:succinoglycan biosynthesis transport protein ExoP